VPRCRRLLRGAFPYIRRFLSGRAESPVSLAAGQLIAGTALLALVTPFGSGPSGPLTVEAVAAVVALGGLGTGLAYVLSYRLIAVAGATTSSTVTYLIPIFSTAAGVLILDEELTWNQPLGALVVLAGIAVSRVGSNRTSPPAPTDP